MALWQFEAQVIPEGVIISRFSRVPDIIPLQNLDELLWRDDMSLSKLESDLGEFIQTRPVWSEEIRGWGSEDGDRIDAYLSCNRIESVVVRIDVRSLNRDFLDKLVEWCKGNNLLLRSSCGRLIYPWKDDILKIISSSLAEEFVADPEVFLSPES